MKQITVFTPTYNRAYCLHKCYESLKRQTNINFDWLIIDDGSTDNTKELVEKWKDEKNKFDIRYIYKNNGGLHTAYNIAIENIETELAMCIDSDDYLSDNCIESVLEIWNKNGSNEYAGVIGLDCYSDGTVIGDLLPKVKNINLIDLLIGKYKINNGDRKIIVRTELYKEVAPMKSFKGEKNFNPHYMHLLISKKYDFLVLNKNLCFVEYQPDGMTRNIIKQYYNSPKSFAEIRKLYLSFPDTSFKFKFKNMIHFISSSILSKNKYFYKEVENKILLVMSIPFGIILCMYIKFKNKSRRLD